MTRTWRIGEVAERTGLTRRTLRHYDELGLLVPSTRTWGDYRLYDADDLLRLLQIQNLKALGLSLAEIADALADPALDAAATLRSHLAHLEQRIAEEQQLANRLRSLAGASERSWDEVLEAVASANRLAHPNPDVRLRAAFQSRDRPAAELLPTLLAEAEPAVADVLVWSMAQQPDAAQLALARLDDPLPQVRATMIRLLGKLGDPASAPALIARLDDPDPQVTAAAVDVLGRLKAPASVPALAALLGSDRLDPAALTEALSGFGADAVGAVAERLASGTPQARAHAAEVLGHLGSAEGVVPLTHALADAEPSVRLAAVLALGGLLPASRAALESALDDPEVGAVARTLLDPHVR